MSTHAITQAAAAANLTAAVTTAQVFALATNAAQPAGINIPGTKRLEGKKFTVRASGVATTTGAATTFAPFLAAGSNVLIASDTILAQAAGVVINNTSAPWWIEAQLIFDSVSGKLNGVFTSLINNTYTGAAPISVVLTGLNSNTEPPFAIVAGATFSVGAVGNVGILDEFALDE